ncbi:MAG: protein translocase subunit SecF [Alphaproteobacteria bacterium]|nr:protein translocase subunit SecF [Alphaproteobacteria bacterium]
MSKLFRKREYKIDFMGQAKLAYILSAIMLLVSVFSFCTRGLNYGIDFVGGVQIEASNEAGIQMEVVREKLSFLKDLSLQSVGTDGTGILIQAQPEGENPNALLTKIKDALGAGYSYNDVQIVGPSIGSELKYKSLLASILALLAIAVYIWFRFEWPFAIGCLLALAHDMIIVVGVFSVFQIEFDMVVVAGLLSLAGYDCNDTIVSYDRMRENLKKYRKSSITELINRSTNETLSRTILTSLTTLFVVLVLLFVGGNALYGFSVVMVLGTILGTYSSIYLAMPLLKYFDLRSLGTSESAEPDFNK